MIPKQCNVCFEIKTVDDFYGSGVSYYLRCKTCYLKDLSEKKRLAYKPIENLPDEIWVGAYGFKKYYKVSNLGRVMAIEKYNYSKKNNSVSYYPNKIMKQSSPHEIPYKCLCLFTSKNKRLTLLVHRLVILSFKGLSDEIEKQFVNHINGDHTDNRLENLEWCTSRENTRHRFLIKKDKIKSSKYSNVSFNKNRNKWHAYLAINGKRKHLGFFNIEDDAFDAVKINLKKHNLSDKYTEIFI